MNPDAEVLLANLEQAGALLSLRGDMIIVDAPKGLLSPADKDELRQSKPELMSLLRARKRKPARDHGLILNKPGKAAPQISAEAFLAQVTLGLKVGVTELLRLEIITQQDITDLEADMYGPEHVDDYRALVEQQLKLKLVTGERE